ncbi:MAG: hypothetical protein P8Y96_08735 [Desulfuromonadales bacterium]|jgi:hypothetical protein
MATSGAAEYQGAAASFIYHFFPPDLSTCGKETLERFSKHHNREQEMAIWKLLLQCSDFSLFEISARC